MPVNRNGGQRIDAYHRYITIVPVEDPDYIHEFCRVLEAVCTKLKLPPSWVLQGGERKDARRVQARDELIDRLRNHPSLTFSYPVIGRYLGMHHSAIIGSVKRTEKKRNEQSL